MTTRLLIGRALSALATALIPTTLTLAVLRSDASDLGLVLAAELLPMLLLLPVGGVLADRLRPERVALAADLVRCLSQLAIGVELVLGVYRVADLAVLSAVAGAAIAFGMPAVPRLVVGVTAEHERLRVNARIGVATSLSAVAAPALAGGVALAAGPGWAAILTALLYACSALTLGGVRTTLRPPGVVRTQRFTADLKEGWREVRRRPWFLASVLGHGVWHFAAGLFLTLGPLAVTKAAGEAAWVLIVQCGTAGLVAGVFTAPKLPIRRPLVVVQVSAALYLLPMAALAAGAPMPLIAAAYGVAMFGLGLLSPLWETAVAAEIPEAALGRVRSFDQLISFASRPLGLAVALPLAGVAGSAPLLMTAGVLVAAANLAAVVRIPAARPPAAPRHRSPAPDRPA
ncbi:MFS transporter [Nonomuraea typhae]|uniref:MFS transporter n=1 Tax=Nonomuraea typhae TaxID=2603600 RepID=A0ABW7YR89_9ACTN